MFSHVTTPNVYVYKLFMLPYLSVPSTMLEPLVSVVPAVNGRQVSLNVSINVSMNLSCEQSGQCSVADWSCTIHVMLLLPACIV